MSCGDGRQQKDRACGYRPPAVPPESPPPLSSSLHAANLPVHVLAAPLSKTSEWGLRVSCHGPSANLHRHPQGSRPALNGGPRPSGHKNAGNDRCNRNPAGPARRGQEALEGGYRSRTRCRSVDGHSDGCRGRRGWVGCRCRPPVGREDPELRQRQGMTDPGAILPLAVTDVRVESAQRTAPTREAGARDATVDGDHSEGRAEGDHIELDDPLVPHREPRHQHRRVLTPVPSQHRWAGTWGASWVGRAAHLTAGLVETAYLGIQIGGRGDASPADKGHRQLRSPAARPATRLPDKTLKLCSGPRMNVRNQDIPSRVQVGVNFSTPGTSALALIWPSVLSIAPSQGSQAIGELDREVPAGRRPTKVQPCARSRPTRLSQLTSLRPRGCALPGCSGHGPEPPRT